jgi:hypothetical protein
MQYVPPAIRRCTDVNLAGLADLDLLTYDAATGTWIVLPRGSLPGAEEPAIFGGRSVNNIAGGGSADGVNLITGAALSVNDGFTQGLNGGIVIPSTGLYQIIFSVVFISGSGDDIAYPGPLADLAAANPHFQVNITTSLAGALGGNSMVFYPAAHADGASFVLTGNTTWSIIGRAAAVGEIISVDLVNDLLDVGIEMRVDIRYGAWRLGD